MPALVTSARPGQQRCPRCHGPMFRDYDSARPALLCLLCGEYLFASPPRRPTVRRPDPARRVAGTTPAA